MSNSAKTTWTEEQSLAIASRGNVLVSASAGSGKTSVMIERIMQIILTGEANVEEILATTFTTLAAEQIKQKLAKAIKKQLPNNPELKKQLNAIPYSNVSTLHSFCANLLRNYFYALDIDANFSIVEGIDQIDLKTRAMDTVFNRLYEEKNPQFLALVEKYLYKRKNDKLKEIVLLLYSFIISEAKPKEKLAEFSTLYTPEGLARVEKDFNEEVSAQLKELSSLLDDLISSCSRYEKLEKFLLVQQDFVSSLKNKTLQERMEVCKNYKAPTSPRKNDDCSYCNYLSGAKSVNEALKNISADIFNFFDYIYTDDKCYFYLYEDFKSLSNLVLDFMAEYDFLKREANLLDFNDIEHLAVTLLENQEIKSEIKSRFKFIFVDEYQDVNPAQEFIIKSLENNNLFLVGDIKQSIYAFRGCDASLFLNTQREFETHGTGTVLQLNKNFRSAKNVINSVNDVFSGILTEEKGGFDYKNNLMVYGGTYDIATNGEEYVRYEGDSEIYTYEQEKNISLQENLSIYEINDFLSARQEEDEACKEGEIIAQIIKDNIGKKYFCPKEQIQKYIGFGDIVILARGLSNHTQKIVKELVRRGIKVSVDNKKEKTTYPEILMLTDLLKTISSHGENDCALLTALRWIANFSDEELTEIRLNSPSRKITFSEAVANYNKNDLIFQKLVKFNEILSSLILTASVSDAGEVISSLIAQTDLEARLGVEYNGAEKVKRLYKFMQMARGKSMEEYLEQLCLGELNFFTVDSDKDSVKVMTIHASKGLEFPVVILCGGGVKFSTKEFQAELIYDRKFGVGMKYRDVLTKQIYPSNALMEYVKRKRKKELVQEEIRLLYVALTRAQYHLFAVGKYEQLAEKIMSFEIDNSSCYFDLIKSDALVGVCVSNKPITASASFSPKQVLIQSVKDKKLQNEISKNLSFTYNEENMIPLKQSVSEISFGQSKIYDTSLEFGESSSEKGSAYHRFLELWDFSKDYSEFYQNGAKTQMGKDYELLEFERLKKICSMEIFSQIKDHTIYKEKQFFVGVPYNLISNELSTKEVVVQGVIDLLAIKNDRAVVIDYKLSTILKDKDLIDKYKKQLAIYCYAVKKLLNIPCECYLINILSQKIIKLSSEDLKL